MKKFLFLLLLLGGGAFGWKACNREKPPVEVQVEKLVKKDLRSVVTGTGQIQPKVSVDISSDVMGRVLDVPVAEGQAIHKGQMLVRIDSSQFESRMAGLRAGLESARASLEQAKVNMNRTQKTFDRQNNMFKQKLVSESDYEAALTAKDNAVSAEAMARSAVAQADAALRETENTLNKYTIVAPSDGILTRKNIEPGEMAVAGTLSTPGALLMTIADLSIMEVEIQVDEIDIVHVQVGQKAEVSVDAFPDRKWIGEVTEVGTSSIESVTSTDQAKNYRVVVTLNEPAQELKPGLSSTADIVTATREQALAVPIQALTVRTVDELQAATPTPAPAATAGSGPPKELEGVFLLEAGKANFHQVRLGIPGEGYFELLEGLKEGDVVITGPYEVLRKLTDGQQVREKGKEPKPKSDATPQAKP